MIFNQTICLLCIFYCCINAVPQNYQHVKFLKNPITNTRKSRSFDFGFPASNHFWDDDDLKETHPNSLVFEETRGHITPDYSNEYPDPFLLTGSAAKRAALILYSKPLFFGEIHHIAALMKNQDIRIRNGLAGHVLGSLRPPWPFYRFKKTFAFSRFF